MPHPGENPDFEALLGYIKQSRGFDFTGYKRSTLMRRVDKRIQAIGIEGYSTYLDYLEASPDEFNHLFNTLLINVTSFFRDRRTWDYIASDIIPGILNFKLPNAPIRVWSAGCASGQEAYTIAMVLAQIIGIEQFRERVKIYATDVDEDALNQARQATYSKSELENLSSEEIELFFEPQQNAYVFRKDLRRSVIFGRHDLIQDPPISRIDLLTCRNTLMYFNANTQARIVSRFQFALNEQGFLCLGKAEMLLAYTNVFMPVDLKHRIFTKVPRSNSHKHLLGIPMANQDVGSQQSLSSRLRKVAFDKNPLACLVIDTNRVLRLANEQARSLFNLTPRDLGRPLQDLEISYRPVELRSCIDQVYSQGQPITVRDVDFLTFHGEKIFLEILVEPLLETENNILGANIIFTDVTRYKRLQADLEYSNQELEMTYEELQSTNEELETTNEELQSSNEELETTNEELQSSNEELETTNEELQSTNEELETMNEELQATNEELHTINDELHRSSEEFNRANVFLESILGSLRGGVVVVNRDLQIQTWNHRAEDLWGLRTEEALGQNFLNIDIGLPVEQLRQPIRDCLAGVQNGSSRSDITLDAINRRGKQITCRVSCTPLVGSDQQIQGVILLMEERSEGE